MFQDLKLGLKLGWKYRDQHKLDLIGGCGYAVAPIIFRRLCQAAREQRIYLIFQLETIHSPDISAYRHHLKVISTYNILK
jgi:hypothetical protein